MTESVLQSVTIVVARYKNVGPEEIKPSDKLSKWDFSDDDRRDLAQWINLYFYNERHMKFDRLLHPDDTAADQTIATIAALVQSLHPRPRTVNKAPGP